VKLLGVEYTPAGEQGLVVLGDHALLRDNGDFYVPSFITRLSCVPQLVFRICRVGKGIAPRFASRYTGEMGVGIRFYAENLLEEARVKGVPPDMAMGFDHAAALSSLRLPAAGEGDPCYAFEVNGEEQFRGHLSGLPLSLDRQIALFSSYCLLKVGDLLYCGNPFRSSGLLPGDRLRLSLEGICLLDFFVR
jgi:2-keto-4-pentenoate hydratase/2-oxohepta-3-ene-1,7-dioic acid hydratase in catechol pathway